MRPVHARSVAAPSPRRRRGPLHTRPASLPFTRCSGGAGFKTNWDLSGTWMPYDGLFLPYVNSTSEQWLNLGPINGGLTQYNVTLDMINSYYVAIQKAGFHSLSYFDIGNWGTRTNTNYHGPSRFCGTRPNGEPAPCPDPDGANSYLRDKLMGSAYPAWGDESCALLHHGVSLAPRLLWYTPYDTPLT